MELSLINNGIENSFKEELFNRWISFLDVSSKTTETYNKAIKQFICYLHNNNINQPTRQTVLNYKEYLKQSELKPTTIQCYITAVKLFFHWTKQENIYPDVADKIKGAKLTTEHKKDYLTTTQVSNLLNSIDTNTIKGIRDFAILSLMITTGLRTIEIIRANIEDFRTLGDFTVLYIQGKGREDKSEYVKIPTEVETFIRKYLTTRKNKNSNEPLFTSIAHRNTEQRLTTRSISRIVKEHLISCGLNSDRISAHSLRHTTATLNLMNGGTLEETRQLLRHTSINTTLIYSHNLDRIKNNSELRVAKAIFNNQI